MAQYGILDIDHPDYSMGPYTIPPSVSDVDKYISNLRNALNHFLAAEKVLGFRRLFGRYLPISA